MEVGGGLDLLDLLLVDSRGTRFLEVHKKRRLKGPYYTYHTYGETFKWLIARDLLL